jgi:anti-anti-sigma factor
MAEEIQFQCKVTKADDSIVIQPAGRVDSRSAGSFESELLGRIEGGEKRVIVDFSDTDYISSAGLRVLLMAAKRLKGDDASFRLCSLKSQIQTVFKASGFDRILSIHADLERALHDQA